MSVFVPGWKTAALVNWLTSAVDLEMAERAPALGVRLAFRYALPVEVRHLLYQVVILQQDRAIRADGQRVLVAGHRDPCIRGRRIYVMVRHDRPLCCGIGVSTLRQSLSE